MLGLVLTLVGRLAQEEHINHAAGPAGPSWQGAKQMHKNTCVYTFRFRLPSKCADEALEHWH